MLNVVNILYIMLVHIMKVIQHDINIPIITDSQFENKKYLHKVLEGRSLVGESSSGLDCYEPICYYS